MSFPQKVKCPHCEAVYDSYGWAEHVRCGTCHRMFEVNIEDSSEGLLERTKEKLDGIWNDENEDAEPVD